MQPLEVTSPPSASTRDSSLDGLRALAIIRVITWHSSGWQWTTWVMSSVPAMFIITGALLTRSFQKNSIAVVLRHRFRRLLPPLWAYCLFVFALSYHFGSRTNSWWTFVLPLDQPTSTIAGQWFTSALWYLRAYIWVLIFSPVLYLSVRKWNSWVPLFGTLCVVVLGLFNLDVGGINWIIGDIVLYATCTAAGMAWLSASRPQPSSLRVPMLFLALSAGGWLLLRTPLDGVVNNDHVLHLFLGGFWATVFLQFPRLLEFVAQTRFAKFLNRYPLSVYLWHSLTAWFMWQLIPHTFPTNLRTVVIVLTTFAALPLVIFVTGLVEHRASHWMTWKYLTPRILVAVLALAAINTSPVEKRVNFVRVPLNQPLPPSAAPKVFKLRIDNQVRRYLNSDEFEDAGWQSRDDEMQTILDRRNKEMKLESTRAVVISPSGHIWHGITGGMKDFDQPSLIGSLTKTFTTTLVMQLVEKGALDLDAPIGDLGMGFSHHQITIRQLLMHSSGLVEYKSKAGSVTAGTTPIDVLRYVSDRPLAYPPGSFIQYSTAGYAILGIILEQTTGRSYEELVQQGITNQLHYEISLFRGQYGSIGFSAGGISMKMDDLADWSLRYLFDRSTTDTPWKWSIKETTGLGVQGYCPCVNRKFMALGHIGGRTFASVDGDGTVVIIDTNGVLVNENFTTTQTFAQELRLVAGGGKKYLYP